MKRLSLFSQIDMDFEILHAKYIVLKINLKLYYVNMISCGGS